MGNEATEPEAATAVADEPSTQEQSSSGDEVISPDLDKKIRDVMSKDDGDSSPTRRARDPQKDFEEAVELASLEGATVDDVGDQNIDLLDEGGTEESVVEPTATGKDSSEDAEATLDSNLRHAAKRGGFSDEDIDELYQANPDLAVKTFSRLHDSYSKLADQFGKMGQQADGSGDQVDGEAVPQSQPVEETEAEADAFDPRRATYESLVEQAYGENLSALREEYGDGIFDTVVNPLIEAVSGPLHQAYQSVAEMKADLEYRDTKREADSFLSENSDLYGSGDDATEEQMTARNELAKLADRIRAGAAQQGVDMSVRDALEQAHTVYSKQDAESSAREKLTEQIAKRTGSRTLRPSNRRDMPGSEPEKGDEAAVRAYRKQGESIGFFE